MRLLPSITACTLGAVLLSAAPAIRSNPSLQKKEYLSEVEADKIRDAGTTGPRIALYTAFAADRIKKLQYEFAHMDPSDDKRAERLNGLINSYTGCIDDAADLVDIGIEKQQDIREGLKVFQTHIKDFLAYLQELAEKGPERETYKENLDDAIEATKDASKDLEKATKEMAPPPVRRKPT